MGASAAADAAEAAFDADDDSAEGVVVGVVTWQVFLVDYMVHARHLEHYGRTFAARHRAQPTSSRYACRTAEHVCRAPPATAVEVVAARPTTQGNRAPHAGCGCQPHRSATADPSRTTSCMSLRQNSMNRAPVRLPV